MSTELSRLCDTPQQVHAAACERMLASDLIALVRRWKWLRAPLRR